MPSFDRQRFNQFIEDKSKCFINTAPPEVAPKSPGIWPAAASRPLMTQRIGNIKRIDTRSFASLRTLTLMA